MSVFALTITSCKKDRVKSDIGIASSSQVAAKINYQMTQPQFNQVKESTANILSLRESALLQPTTRKTDVSIVLKANGNPSYSDESAHQFFVTEQ